MSKRWNTLRTSAGIRSSGGSRRRSATSAANSERSILRSPSRSYAAISLRAVSRSASIPSAGRARFSSPQYSRPVPFPSNR
eukprot:scaffold304085_cov17-Tisochrysis_lutea.AAC.1